MKTVKHNKTVSLLLAMTLLSITNSNAFAVGTTTNDDFGDIAQTDENFALPDIVTSAEAEEYGFVSRDYDAEPNLNTFIFNNADGTNTMKVYAHPVKYENKDGKIKDITLNLNQNRDGSFTTADNNIITTLPNELSQGISLTYEDIHLRMIPETGKDNITAKYDERTRQVTYQADEQTSYVYGLTYAGFKEDIVVTEYTGQTDYCFTLYTDGLALTNKEGTFFLTDKEGETAANLSDIIVYTADDRNNTFGSMTYRTVKENEQYDLTIHLDEEFLRSEETSYPICIDPSIVVNHSSGGINTTSIFSDYTLPSMPTTLSVGKCSSARVARSLMQFPELDLNNIHSSLNVNSAKVDLYNENYQSDAMVVYCYQFGGLWVPLTAWWILEQDTDKNIYTRLSAQNIKYSNGVNLSTPHRYSFDVTLAVKRWVDEADTAEVSGENVFTPVKGLIFKSNATVEGSDITKYKTFASSYSASNWPSLTIVFTYGVRRNTFYSKYSPQIMNQTVFSDYRYKYIKRMNCYGYAFCNILAVETTLDSGAYYLQQPGEFADIDDMVNVKSKLQVTSANNKETVMQYIINNMNLDAYRLGYAISEYTPSSSNGYKVEQFGTDSRLIAVVASPTNYHFYMQHSDGTWSHKPGYLIVRNVSLSSSGDYGIGSDSCILTNDNIYYQAAKGDYTGGLLKFFIITKNAFWDYPHTDSCLGNPVQSHSTSNDWPNCGHTNLLARINYYREHAGDFCENAAVLSNSLTVGRFDYSRDHDVFFFTPSQSGNYTFTISTIASSSLYFNHDSSPECTIYNNNGVTITSNTGDTTVSVTANLQAGSQYYIDIADDDDACRTYTLSYSFT